MNLNVMIAMKMSLNPTHCSSLDKAVKRFIRIEIVHSAATVGIGTEIEGFERTQTTDPTDKVNMGP